MSEADREVLERERLRNATRGELGIFGEMQACFKGNTLMPGFLERDGAGQFVVDIGLGYDAKETRLAVKNGFVVLSFDLLPTNIRLFQQAVKDDSRYVFVELQKQGEQWVLPELQQPPAGSGFAYVFNAAIADEETTIRFPENAARSYTQSILDGKRNGAGIEVPVLPLRKFLPKWLGHIDYLKVDTQGYELKVLNGCFDMLQHTRYIAYEFSPWLMKRAHSGSPMELLQLLPTMGSLCYTASPPHEHLRAGIPWPIETWYKHLDEGKSTGPGIKHNVPPNDPYGPWVDIFCYWPFRDAPNSQTAAAPPPTSLPTPMTQAAPKAYPLASSQSQQPQSPPQLPQAGDTTWVINRTIQDVMLDQLCPEQVTKNMSEADREVLERERLRNATRGELGIFGEMQACFKGNTLMPGFLERDGAGQFVVDIGLGYDAKETRLAVKNGFVVLSFDLLPTNIRLFQQAVKDDSRYVFVELQKQGEQWVLPELQQPPAGSGFAYVFNAAIADEETTIRFPENAARSYTQSILDGKRNGAGIEVPVLPLRKFLPKWLGHIDYLKVDTQGYELKVLNGCFDMLQHTRYIAYEFSPWLMKRAHSGSPMELLQLLPTMGSLCYTASPPHEHLRAGIPWPIETWYKHLDEGKSTGPGIKHNVPPNDPYGPWVDIFCYWPFRDAPNSQTAAAPPPTSLPTPMTQAAPKAYPLASSQSQQPQSPPQLPQAGDTTWVINRTIQDVMLDQLCPEQVTKNMSEADREVLERERLRNATRGELGIFGEMQACFKGNTLMPGFLERDGAGQFVVDIGLGYDAKETRLAVKNGFVVLSFDLLPTNIRLFQQAVKDDSRYVFVELQKQGEQWVLPELQQPPAGSGFAYVFNAAIADEETTIRFPENAARSYTQSILDGKRNGAGIEVPVLPLRKFLPKWLGHIDYLKVDTQGYELKVLNGCLDMLQRTRYIAYEFSPWLMKRAHSGNPMELLQLLPTMGSLCYTASPPFEYLRAGIPWPIETWYKHLDEGKSTGPGIKHNVPPNDPYGPWVDIFCYWPFRDVSSFQIEPPTVSPFGSFAGTEVVGVVDSDSHGNVRVSAGIVPFPHEWRTHELTFLVGLIFGACCVKCLRA